ncbi:NAD(P)/FAD-dependent oxidoreductase [Zeaxanthinibacter sp. PT1]|uniref:NAD(P)/FAD-dependent oxidoreductase n=1 Tax=Zeaxanthinibacter TaxID=561554 RepID=UPI002349DF73|nr:NAD(P)/FAD-dependent oxidoreductase [Zeaxanthinibacter sp. PT1]MDC6351183.1 NAD(P)/FAD-dependent oxidoreductase [Zeaxanthinibacter sp. PT1]
MYDVIVIGGGAAGFYGAIHAARQRPEFRVLILERSKQVLSKVRISGGGRCNVTHAQYDPKALVRHYPRGNKELLGPFYGHSCGETQAFFEELGVALKTEEDGRMFPVTDSSQTIIDCLMGEVSRLGIELHRSAGVQHIERSAIKNNEDSGYWAVRTSDQTYMAKNILVATGSSPKMWELLQGLGHRIIPPVPSLFTFNIKDPRIEGIPGISTQAIVKVVTANNIPKGSGLEAEGPLLITHWGLSGPAILKLSAWGARILHELDYHFKIEVNWLPGHSPASLEKLLLDQKAVSPRKGIQKLNPIDIPKRLWSRLVAGAGIGPTLNWAELSKQQLQDLSGQILRSEFDVRGKSTFKEEFVTAGGVDLKEINFQRYESKIHPGLYLAGEVINVDAVTGGYNFQNAWTGAYLAAMAISET